MISEDSANRLREKLESFGTGPEADLRRDAYIHNTMIEGSTNFQLSVELARIAICSGESLWRYCSRRAPQGSSYSFGNVRGCSQYA